MPTWCTASSGVGWVVAVVAWAVLVGLTVWAVCRLFPTQVRADARTVLEERLASGELDVEHYRELRQALDERSASEGTSTAPLRPASLDQNFMLSDGRRRRPPVPSIHTPHGYWRREMEKAMGTSTIDPVCGMTVDPATALSAEVDGQTYYFCAAGCRKAFVSDPGSFLHSEHEGHHEHGGHQH